MWLAQLLRHPAVTRFLSRQPFIVGMAVSVHLTWGVLALISAEGSHSTAASALGWRPQVTGVMLLTVAFSACAAMCVRSTLLAVALTVPQQLVLAFSADAAVHAMWSGVYADGTVRGSLHITADQCWAVFLCFWHAFAIGVVAWRGDHG